MRKSLSLILAFLAMGLVVFALATRPAPQFPPKGISCFDAFSDVVKMGYADPVLNPPQFSFDHVSHFRCRDAKGFIQYEVRGVDNDGHAFYYHHGVGGVAATGADMYFDFCYTSDGVVVQSDKITWQQKHEKGSCAWREGFPVKPLSDYEYTKAKS